MKLAEGTSVAPNGTRPSRGSVGDRYSSSLQQSGRASNAEVEGELNALRRQSSGAKMRYEESLKTGEPRAPPVSPPRKKTVANSTPAPAATATTKPTDPDLATSPRLADNPFLKKDPDSKVAKAANKPVPPRWCKCFA